MKRKKKKKGKKRARTSAAGLFQTALGFHQTGKTAQAAELYGRILETDPGHADSLHLLGIIEFQSGKTGPALEKINKAIRVSPRTAIYHNSLGNVRMALGNTDEAIAAYRKAADINPNYAEVFNNMGSAYLGAGRYEKASECFRRAVAVKPDYAVAYNNLGTALKNRGMVEDALEIFLKSLDIMPNNVETCNKIGIALRALNRLEEAISFYERALGINPNRADIHNNLGNAWKDSGNRGKAFSCYEQALKIDPRHAEANNNLGNILKESGRIEEAVACYRKAVALKPDYAEAHNNLGHLLTGRGLATEAVACFQKALASRPDYAEAYNNMGNALIDLGDLKAAAACYGKCVEIRPDFDEAHSNLLVIFHYDTELSSQDMFARHLEWARMHADPLMPEASDSVFGGLPAKTDSRAPRLKIGYVSPDFRVHSCAYFIEPLLRMHDKTNFEIFCYAQVERPDDTTRRIREHADHWFDTVGKSDDEVADRVRSDGIDILVDLAGHFAKNRLTVFARKPAPIQATWLGYPDTTGMKAMDYRFTDSVADPRGADAFHTETLVRLPGFLCYDPIDNTPDIADPPCLKSGRISFGSFNNPAKVNENVVRIWSEILLQVPGSRLLFKGSQLADPNNRKRFAGMFQKYGVGPGQIVMAGRNPDKFDHFLTYNQVDIALDPFPYNGTTTTCEALWMGVPVIALCGGRHVSRVGASILTRAGLAELIGENETDYVRKAVALASDTKMLCEYRRGMRARLARSGLCDARAFARSVEDAYLQMWQKRNSRPENQIHGPDIFKSAVDFYNAAQFDQCGEACRQILEIAPNHADAIHILGVIAAQSGDNGTALDWIDRAIRINPENAGFHNSRGNVLNAAGQAEQALACYQKAIELKPDFAGACYNLGVILGNLGRMDEAVSVYKRALGIAPNYAEALNGLGNIFREQGRFDEADAHYRRALEINPRYADAHNNLGNSLKDRGMVDAAIEHYRKALEINPGYAEGYNNLGHALKDPGRLREAVESFEKALQIRPNYVKAHSNLLATLQYFSDLSPETIYARHRQWDEIHAKPVAAEIKPHGNDPSPERRLRVGYVSPDFRFHSCAYFIEPLLRSHDKGKIEVFCYAEIKKPDAMTDAIRRYADVWRPTVGKTHEIVADMIRTDRIDILVDLAGHSAKNRLLVFARKPAPVQVSWLGYPDTTGLSAMDYRLTDRLADPEGESDKFAVEALVRLPVFLCFSPVTETPEIRELPALKGNRVTFGSFNNLSKVTPDVVAAWSEILRRTPDSRLVLKCLQLADESTGNRYKEMFAKNGVDSDRIAVLAQTPARQDHLDQYNSVDIGLDPFPYNGTTTTCEALWMGVPVITLRGHRHVGRVGADILARIGLEELVAETVEQYAELAADLASDTDRTNRYRKSLRQMMRQSAICDVRSFSESVEAAYRRMWAKWCGSKTAASEMKGR